jgi:hypothetical protein
MPTLVYLQRQETPSRTPSKKATMNQSTKEVPFAKMSTSSAGSEEERSNERCWHGGAGFRMNPSTKEVLCAKKSTSAAGSEKERSNERSHERWQGGAGFPATMITPSPTKIQEGKKATTCKKVLEYEEDEQEKDDEDKDDKADDIEDDEEEEDDDEEEEDDEEDEDYDGTTDKAIIAEKKKDKVNMERIKFHVEMNEKHDSRKSEVCRMICRSKKRKAKEEPTEEETKAMKVMATEKMNKEHQLWDTLYPFLAGVTHQNATVWEKKVSPCVALFNALELSIWQTYSSKSAEVVFVPLKEMSNNGWKIPQAARLNAFIATQVEEGYKMMVGEWTEIQTGCHGRSNKKFRIENESEEGEPYTLTKLAGIGTLHQLKSCIQFVRGKMKSLWYSWKDSDKADIRNEVWMWFVTECQNITSESQFNRIVKEKVKDNMKVKMHEHGQEDMELEVDTKDDKDKSNKKKETSCI